MSRQTINFEGRLALDQSVIDQVEDYLDKKETNLSYTLLQLLPSGPIEESLSLVPPKTIYKLKLSESLESFSKQLRQLTQNSVVEEQKADLAQLSQRLNKSLWIYLEALENCTTELFQQIAQIGIVDWKIELAEVVETLKEGLIHRLDDMSWCLKRLEKQLKVYRNKQGNDRGLIKQLFLYWQSFLDQQLKINLEKCQKFLLFQFQEFSIRYKRYAEMITEVDMYLKKLIHYSVLTSLDSGKQQKLKKIMALLRLSAINHQYKVISAREPLEALSYTVNTEEAIQLFKEYYQAIKNHFFKLCKSHKENKSLTNEENLEKKETLLLKNELHTLSATLLKYKDSLIQLDPNPYVRGKIGFPEGVAGQESPASKKLSKLNYSVQDLDHILEDFDQITQEKELKREVTIQEVESEIEPLLHEIQQPLISRVSMQLQMERIIQLIMQLDELVNPDEQVVHYIGKLLGKLMRADWKYQVLFKMASFHRVYLLHSGLLDKIEEVSHLKRLKKFKHHLQQIQQWIKNYETIGHTQEIEWDISDMKESLQDFLAQSQRLINQQDQSNRVKQQEIAQQLVEYRYLFGNFFSHLDAHKIDQRLMRRQFLFVNYYFESIENLLEE